VPTVAPRRHRLRVEFLTVESTNSRSVSRLGMPSDADRPLRDRPQGAAAPTPLEPAVVPEVTTEFAGDASMAPAPSDVLERSRQGALDNQELSTEVIRARVHLVPLHTHRVLMPVPLGAGRTWQSGATHRRGSTARTTRRRYPRWA